MISHAEAATLHLRKSHLESLASHAREYVRSARSSNTQRAYSSDWRQFENWCRQSGLASQPAEPETIALYMTALTTGEPVSKVSTIRRRLSAIRLCHSGSTDPNPAEATVVKLVLAGIVRQKGSQVARKRPILATLLRAMLERLPDTLAGTRDRALLLTGFAAALRRSELVALDWEDLTWTAEGVYVHIRRSKTDQQGKGRTIGIPVGKNEPTCPVQALLRWRERSGVEQGPLFRGVSRNNKISPQRLADRSVARIVKLAVAAAGQDASNYAAHSLRAGLATSAAIAGASERSIMNQTGHRSLLGVRMYIRDADLFRDNAASAAGL